MKKTLAGIEIEEILDKDPFYSSGDVEDENRLLQDYKCIKYARRNAARSVLLDKLLGCAELNIEEIEPEKAEIVNSIIRTRL